MTLPRRVAGMVVATWRYMTRKTRIVRLSRRSAADRRTPDPDRRMVGDAERIQRRTEGHGPMYRRSYRVRIAHPALSPDELIEKLSGNLNLASPVEVATFEKVSGPRQALAPGDEYVVRMPGPWDGPVRVVQRTACSFRLVTLKGHMEAGEIDFCARAGDPPDRLEFEIRSWARSGNRLFNWLYDRLWLPREMQLHMWVHFCERVVQLAGGRMDGPVVVTTDRWAAR